MEKRRSEWSVRYLSKEIACTFECFMALVQGTGWLARVTITRDASNLNSPRVCRSRTACERASLSPVSPLAAVEASQTSEEPSQALEHLGAPHRSEWLRREVARPLDLFLGGSGCCCAGRSDPFRKVEFIIDRVETRVCLKGFRLAGGRIRSLQVCHRRTRSVS